MKLVLLIQFSSIITLPLFLNGYEATGNTYSHLYRCNYERIKYHCYNLIDTGSEVTFFQDFLLPQWDKLPSNLKIRITSVHPSRTYLDLVQNNVSIVLGNKVLTIATVLQYNSEHDILLGNDFH